MKLRRCCRACLGLLRRIDDFVDVKAPDFTFNNLRQYLKYTFACPTCSNKEDADEPWASDVDQQKIDSQHSFRYQRCSFKQLIAVPLRLSGLAWSRRRENALCRTACARRLRVLAREPWSRPS